jgi:hypothetical protein
MDVNERRQQHRLRTLLKNLDERMVRVERIAALLIEKGLLDSAQLSAEGLLSPPLASSPPEG